MRLWHSIAGAVCEPRVGIAQGIVQCCHFSGDYGCLAWMHDVSRAAASTAWQSSAYLTLWTLNARSVCVCAYALPNTALINPAA